MGLSLKCDICRKVYKPYGLTANHIRVCTRNPNSSSSITPVKTYDCCPECVDAITHLIGNRSIQ